MDIALLKVEKCILFKFTGRKIFKLGEKSNLFLTG